MWARTFAVAQTCSGAFALHVCFLFLPCFAAAAFSISGSGDYADDTDAVGKDEVALGGYFHHFQ